MYAAFAGSLGCLPATAKDVECSGVVDRTIFRCRQRFVCSLLHTWALHSCGRAWTSNPDQPWRSDCWILWSNGQEFLMGRNLLDPYGLMRKCLANVFRSASRW